MFYQVVNHSGGIAKANRLGMPRLRQKAMEGSMFYASGDQIRNVKKGVLKHGVLRIGALNVGVSDDERLADQDTLKHRCLESASLWVLKRRANLPHMRPRSLPAVARSG